MRTLNENYDAADASVFINKVLVHAGRIRVQVAHMAGWGGYDEATDAALQAFIDAFNNGTISRSNIFFDISAVLPQPGESWTMDIGNSTTQKQTGWDAKAALLKKIHAIGSSNILFGSDWPEINIKDYLEDLDKNLGSVTSSEILRN